MPRCRLTRGVETRWTCVSGSPRPPRSSRWSCTDDADHDKVVADIEKLLKTGDGVLWLTDRKGRRVGVPVAKVAYVEVGAPPASAASDSAPPSP